MVIELSVYKTVKIRSLLCQINQCVDKLKSNDKRTHGVNPIFNEITEKCLRVDTIINTNCELISDDGKCFKTNKFCSLKFNDCPEKQGTSDINRTFKKIYKNVPNLLLKEQPNEGKYWIPIELIKKKFNIPGELDWSEFDRSIFGEDNIKYLYIKVK